MKYTLEFTHQYLKDLKQARRRQLDESKRDEGRLILALVRNGSHSDLF